MEQRILPEQVLTLVCILLVCLAAPLLAEDKPDAKRSQSAYQLVEKYFALEESRDYRNAYALLSSAYRRALKEENGVGTSEQYKKLRGIKGLKWEHAKITDVSLDSQLNASVAVTVEYEQGVYGEHVVIGKVDLNVLVVWENDKPFIDSITLSSVH